MARGKRKVPDINSSSTADIAFLLLIFFLITTSMDTDRGLARLLPPPPEDQDQQNTDKIKERNILQVYLNKDDALMCGNDYIGVEQLREKAKEFIANAGNAEHMPEKTQKNVEFFGDEIDRIVEVDVLTGEVKCSLEHTMIFPASFCFLSIEVKY